jgi:hypothetical protein
MWNRWSYNGTRTGLRFAGLSLGHPGSVRPVKGKKRGLFSAKDNRFVLGTAEVKLAGGLHGSFYAPGNCACWTPFSHPRGRIQHLKAKDHRHVRTVVVIRMTLRIVGIWKKA